MATRRRQRGNAEPEKPAIKFSSPKVREAFAESELADEILLATEPTGAGGKYTAKDVKAVAAANMSEIDEFMASVVERAGEGAVTIGSQLPDLCLTPTGCFIIDFALLGGFVDGAAGMMYGLESCGKTTIFLKAVAAWQRKYPTKRCLWVDAESMYDPHWARALGVDTDRIIVHKPVTGEEAVDVIDAAQRTLEIGLVVLDSIPTLVPMQLDADTVGENALSAENLMVAPVPKLCGRMITNTVKNWNSQRKRGHKVTMFLVNQFRFKIGTLPRQDPRTLPGGRQINHFPVVKIELKNYEKMGEDRYGTKVVSHNEHSFRLTKHKVGASITEGVFEMIINPDNSQGLPQGTFDDFDTVIHYGKKMDYILGGGGSFRPVWWEEGTGIKQGELKQRMIDDPILYASLKKSIIAAQRRAKGLKSFPPDGFLLSHEGTAYDDNGNELDHAQAVGL